METLEKVNIGLASKEFVALINAYKAALYARDSFTKEAYPEIHQRALDFERTLECALRKEAYEGYTSYYKKLGLPSKMKHDLFIIKDNCLEIRDISLRKKDEKNIDDLCSH